MSRWSSDDDLRRELTEVETRQQRLLNERDNLDARIQAGADEDGGLAERLANVNRGIANADQHRRELEAELGRRAFDRERLRVAVASGHVEGAPTSTRDRVNGHDTARMPFDPSRGLLPTPGGEVRDRALRTVERYTQSGVLRGEAADRLDSIIARSQLDAAYIEAVGDPAYERAFEKVLRHYSHGHLYFTPDEVQAWQRTLQVEQTRAMVIGTGSAGGFGVPFTLDPTILLTSSGALNPVRQIARVFTIPTDQWKGVSSQGVTATYAPEATEATDASPTLAQPVIDAAMGRAFVPYSIELSMDWQSITDELQRLIADARDVLDATKFLSGSGTDEPGGVLTGLTTTQRQQTTTVAVYALGDPWLLKSFFQTNAARFVANSTFAANSSVWDTTYRFVGGNSGEPKQFDDGRGGPFLGRPKVEWSTMSTATTTTGSKIMLLGDFTSGFYIADRIGLSVELIPHLFGATSRFPTGQRGLYAYWRTGSKVVNPTAFAYLEVK